MLSHLGHLCKEPANEILGKNSFYVSSVVSVALQEDVGTGDLTGLLIPEKKQIRANVVTREDCIVCGCQYVDEVFRQVDRNIVIEWNVVDGQRARENTGNNRTLKPFLMEFARAYILLCSLEAF